MLPRVYHWATAVMLTVFIRVSYEDTDGPMRFEDILPPRVQRTYDKMKPPKKNGKPTAVDFHVTVMQIDSINENSMTYVADIFFAQSWKDDRLALPENMTSEYRLLELEWLESIWRPDSFFKNAKSVTFQRMTIPNHYVWLYADKTILYMVKLTLTLSCAMNFVMYPHDYQECRLQMESLSYTTDDLIFVWEKSTPLVVDENIQLPQLDLIHNYTADCSHAYPTGNFTCLEVVFKFKRRLGYYLFHTYIPTCLIVIMSWISFWIKPEAAPARVTLGVTSLLTLSTQHAKSQASLPPVSYVKSIDSFMNACTVFVFLALIEYALVNIVLGDSPEPGSKLSADHHHQHDVHHQLDIHHQHELQQHNIQHQQQLQQQHSVHYCSHQAQSETAFGRDKIFEMTTRERELPPYSQPGRARGGSCPRHGSQCVAGLPTSSTDRCSARLPAAPLADQTAAVHQERARLLSGRPPQPASVSPQQIRRRRAINVDRVSRVLFPTTFLLLNALYWLVVKFVEDD